MVKGKKSAKLASMTDEEKLLYLEQQRLAEEELKKKKEDMLQQFLKDKLAKEEKASKFNLNKINHQWRSIMRETKSKELKKDIEILSQTFERVIDRKESVINSLVKDLQEAEDQYSMALRSHLTNTDNIIDIQRQRITQLKKEFDNEQTTLMIEFDSERKRMTEQHQREITELQDIIYAMEQNFKDQEDEAKAEFQSMRDEIKNKNMEEKHALRVQLDQMIQNVWSQFQQAMKNYQDTTQDRKKAFEELKLKDEKSSEEIEKQMKKLKEIGDKIAQLKAKMAANAKECDERNRLLREEKEVMQSHLRELKSQMNEMHEIERQRLAKLTIESNAALKELKKKIEKGENILKLAEMCRKLETEEEKVLPFYASSLTAEEEEEVAAAVAEPPFEKLAEAMYKYSSLENFWKRYNKVQLDKLALDREKTVLMQENQQLRMLLKQYLDGISVNDEVISQVNPLFVVNYKSNVNRMNVPIMDGRVKRQGTTLPPIQTSSQSQKRHISKR